MNCYEIVENCTNIICAVKWQVTRINQQTYDICTRYAGTSESDKKCIISIEGTYTGRTRYDVNGVIQIDDLRRNESGIYSCNCVCPPGQTVTHTKSYYGIIIVRE